MARLVNRLVLFFARHWLALVNSVLALVLGLAFLAPWLMLHSQTGVGALLYWAYQPVCHQLPERSFFLGGPQPWYSFAELTGHLGYEAPARFVGNLGLGYKVALCERDTAIYAGWLLAGLVYGLFRGRVRQLPWQWLVILGLPMAVDGLLQFFGVLESTWWRRTATGLLFAVGVIWFAFPLLEWGMKDACEIAWRSQEETRAGDR